MSISIAASSALLPRQGAPAECALSPLNMYSTDTRPLLVPSPPVARDVREKHEVDVLEVPLADVVRLGAEQLFRDAGKELDGPLDFLALHDLLQHDRRRDVHRHAGVVPLSVARSTLDERVVVR